MEEKFDNNNLEKALWKTDILTAMLERRSMQDILGIIEQKILNPFSVLDNNNFILGRSKGYDMIPPGTIWDKLKGNALNIFDYYSTEEWKRLSAKFSDAGREPVLYKAERDPAHTYCSIALFNEGQRIGSIGSIDSHVPFDEGQLDLLRMVRDMFEIYLREEMISSARDEITSDVLSSFIGEKYSESTADELMAMGWDSDDEFEVTAFDFSDVIRSDAEMASCLSLVKMQFPDSMIAPSAKQVIMCEDVSRQRRHQDVSVESFMVQHDLYGGRSYRFAGFANCSIYWKQASYAAHKSVRLRDRRITEYKDVQFKHMKETFLRDKSYAVWLNPSLVILAKSHKKSDRILVSCLRAYLLNGRSLSRTSSALGIHRNTLIYRIRRLEEILGLYFDMLTDDQMGVLIMSCCIIESDAE